MLPTGSPIRGRLATAGGFALAVMLAAPAVPAFAAPNPHHAGALAKRPAAHATMVRGVVVARNLARHTVVVSSPAGIVHTVRLASAPATRRVAIGADVLARSVLLGDGTYHALALRAHGRAHRARVRGTVVRSFASRLLLSAGGSVFSIASHARGIRAHATGTTTTPQAGEVVEATVAISQNSVQQTQLQQLGQTGIIGLEGVLSSITSSAIVVAVDQGALTTVTVPASLTLPPTIAVGDRVEVLAAYANQAFSLVTIKDDTLAAAQASQGVSQVGDGQSATVEAEGLVLSVSSTSLVVQPGNGATQVSFAVPTGIDVSTIAAGDQVHARGTIVSNVLTLTSVAIQQPEGEQANTELTGTVSAMDATSLSVTPSNGGAPVTYAIPTGITLSGAIVVGGEVHVRGTLVNNVLTLTSAQVPDSASVHVVGPVISLDATSLVVQSSDTGEQVTFTVPTGFDLTGVAAGVQVSARGTLVSGTPELTSVQVRSGD